MKKYKVIFTLGDQRDEESLQTGQRGDVLILDEEGLYYDPYFITLKRIEGEFLMENSSYICDKLVILHSVTKSTIIESVADLHNWQFFKRWSPLEEEAIMKFYYPKDDWEIVEVEFFSK